MQYTDPGCAYQILGVYHVHRSARDVYNLPRDYVAIGFRIQGNSTFSYDGGTFHATGGSTLFLPKGVAFRNCRHAPEELVIVHLKPFGDAPGVFRLYRDTGSLEPLFRKLHTLWESGDYNRSMALLYEIFSLLEAPESQVPQAIAPGVMLLRREFKNPKLTVEQAAAACFISQVYFRKIYRQHFGISPLQGLLNLRFDYAAQLLRSGYYSVEQVARQAGFSDVKYFRTAFTRRFGFTPTQYKGQEHRISGTQRKETI